MKKLLIAFVLSLALLAQTGVSWIPSCTVCQWQLDPLTGSGVPVTFTATGLNPRYPYYLRYFTADPLPGHPSGIDVFCCERTPDQDGTLVYGIGFSNNAATYTVQLYRDVPGHGNKPNPLVAETIVSVVPLP